MRSNSTKKQRLANEVLPTLTITKNSIKDILEQNKNKKIKFEIGSGSGETCTGLAKNNENDLIIACEPFLGGVLQICSKIEEYNIQNIKIFQGDGREVLLEMKDNSMDDFYLLFPDPWPKAKHKKRRIFNTDFLNLLSKKMKQGSSLWIATDSDSYKDHIAEILFQELIAKNNPDFIWNEENRQKTNQEPIWWHKTKYQAKAEKEGRICTFLHLNKI